MLMPAWILVLLVISLVLGDSDHVQSHDISKHIKPSRFGLERRGSLEVDHAMENSLNVLRPREAGRTRISASELEKLSLSSRKDDNRQQAGSSKRKSLPIDSIGRSSMRVTQGPSSSRISQDRGTSPSRKEVAQKKGTTQEINQVFRATPASTSSPQEYRQPNGGQYATKIETAQTNIAREPANSLRGSSSPGRPSVRANAAIPADTPDRPAQINLSDINLTAIGDHHKKWMAGIDTDIGKASINARRKAAAGVLDMRTPPAIQKGLNLARAKAKGSRDVAKSRVDTAVDSMHSRPISSPNTRVQMASAGWASKTAVDDVTDYYNKEKEASVTAAAHSRWRDFPRHVKKYARAVTRGSAMESYHNARLAEYQSKLDRNAVSNMSPDDPGRRKAVGLAVDSSKDFNVAAKLYYLRDAQYREVRDKYAEGDSSEDESYTFPSVPRGGS